MVLQLAMNAPTALAPTLSGKARPKGGSGPGAAETYGLTMWFKVAVVTGCTGVDLGNWSACSGLVVKFTQERFDVGGGFGPKIALPDRVEYEDITLERAMNPADSPKVRSWLNAVNKAWRDGDGVGWSSEHSRIIITLYSGLNTPAIAQWVLHNVAPVSWTGPSLAGTGGGVAIEKLVLRHNGFLADAAGAAATPGLRLRAVDGGQEVRFSHLPDKLNITKNVVMQEPSNRMHLDRHIGSISPVRLDISDLRIDGAAEVARIVRQLWDWLLADDGTPVTAGRTDGPAIGPARPTVGAADAPTSRKAKVLSIAVGTDTSVFSGRYVLNSVDVSYTRFTSGGTPSRASIKLSIEETGQWRHGASPAGGGAVAPAGRPQIGAARAAAPAGGDPVRAQLAGRAGR